MGSNVLARARALDVVLGEASTVVTASATPPGRGRHVQLVPYLRGHHPLGVLPRCPLVRRQPLPRVLHVHTATQLTVTTDSPKHFAYRLQLQIEKMTKEE